MLKSLRKHSFLIEDVEEGSGMGANRGVDRAGILEWIDAELINR